VGACLKKKKLSNQFLARRNALIEEAVSKQFSALRNALFATEQHTSVLYSGIQ
jgi:hypothetical protein